jgi:hypothetical protein
MSEEKMLVWFAALGLLAFVLFTGEPDIVDALRTRIAATACPAQPE